MKPQDILFLLIFAGLIITRKPKLLVYSALTLLLASIPLFAFHVFFTAQRFTYYAFFLLLLITVFEILQLRKEK